MKHRYPRATKECGCYDGPISVLDPSLVSIRCRGHMGRVPALADHALGFWYNNNFRPVAASTRKPLMATSIKNRRKDGSRHTSG